MSFSISVSGATAAQALADFSTALAQAATDNSLASSVVTQLQGTASSNVGLLPTASDRQVRISLDAISDAGAFVSLNISAGLI